MNRNYDAWVDVPFGTVAIAMNSQLQRIDLLSESLLGTYQLDANPLAAKIYNQIIRYLTLPSFRCDLPSLPGTQFQQRVWRAIYAIPFGETLTYGQLADQISSGPRAVANACGANPYPIIIPCHRVVAINGIGGFMQGKTCGVSVKQWLLRHEGILLTGRDDD